MTLGEQLGRRRPLDWGVLLQTSEPHEQRQSVRGRVAFIEERFLFFLQKQDGGGEGAPGILCRQGLHVWRWVVPGLGSLTSFGKRAAVPSFQTLGEREQERKKCSRKKARVRVEQALC